VFVCLRGECAVDKSLQTAVMEQPVTGLELTCSELEQQLADIRADMEKRTERAAKYKRLYHEMTKKYEEVTAQLHTLHQVSLCHVSKLLFVLLGVNCT